VSDSDHTNKDRITDVSGMAQEGRKIKAARGSSTSSNSVSGIERALKSKSKEINLDSPSIVYVKRPQATVPVDVPVDTTKRQTSNAYINEMNKGALASTATTLTAAKKKKKAGIPFLIQDPPPRPANQIRKDVRRCARTSSSEDGTVSPNTPGTPRVAIVFFGISRALKWTLPTFERHLFDVLDAARIEYDVFWSSMVAPTINNPRSNERIIALDEYDVRLMRPCRFMLIDQESVRHKEFLRFCRARKVSFAKDKNRHIYKVYDPNSIKGKNVNSTIRKSGVRMNCPFRDPFMDGLGSLKNLLCALYSQREVADMVSAYADEHNVQYDAIVSVRPDTAMSKDIDLPQNLEALQQSTRHGKSLLYVANFHHWGGYNDRFAYGNPQAMLHYLTRGESYLMQPGTKIDVGEAFLRKYLELKQVEVRMSSMLVIRVRVGGRVEKLDLMLLAGWKDKSVRKRCLGQNNTLALYDC
jgi:hypothetical protein